MSVNDINEPVLDRVEEGGGGYVEEPEVFIMTVSDAYFHDTEAEQQQNRSQ